MINVILAKLMQGGRYSLHYLIKLSHETAGTLRLVNNNEDITYDGEKYTAATFEYTPPDSKGSGGNFRISSAPGENGVFEFVENADYKYKLEVVGVMVEGGAVSPIHLYKHFFGEVTIDADNVIEWSLEGDDRLQMTFNPYTYDTDNNRGNA